MFVTHLVSSFFLSPSPCISCPHHTSLVFFLSQGMVQGQTLYLHTMLENGDLEKVIVNGISFIHCSLQTTINKMIQTLTFNQRTANNLSILILATDVLPANTLGKAIKAALLSIRDWKRLTNVAINALKTEST
jgi:hypothetical protein